MTTIQRAIIESASTNTMINLTVTAEQRAELIVRAAASLCDGRSMEAWGTDEDGREWHIHAMIKVSNLDELLAILRDGGFWDGMDDLPDFGGAPVDAEGVWSWDADRVLVGDGSNFRIIARAVARGGYGIDA